MRNRENNELLPLARQSSASADDSLHYLKCTSSALSSLLFRLLPLVLFALFQGTYFLGIYTREGALEDVEYRGGQLRHNASSAASNYHDRLPRWKRTGNDCAADQRLANTTDLQCGVAINGTIVIEPLISNEPGMCGGVTMEPNYCLMPSTGEWTWEQSNETLPPLPRRFGVPDRDRTKSLSRCKTQDEFLNGKQQGSSNEFDREWVPNSCSVVPLSPFHWTHNSKSQVTIVMMGDSHIRNLFTATVHGLRGDSAFAESHPESQDKDTGIMLTYEWRQHENKTASDRYVVHTNTNNNNHTHLFEDCSFDEKNTRCLRIVFIWSPRFDDQVKHTPLLNDLQTDLMIVGPGNSYEKTTVLSKKWTHAMETMLLQPNEHRHLAVLHFPYGEQPKGRPEAIKAWMSSNHTTHANNRISYWQQGQLGFGGEQSANTWHYACGLGRSVVRNDVVMAIEECTDEADTAYIRAITTIHFDAFSAH